MIPFFYAVVHYQYLCEGDMFPEFRAELALAIQHSIPKDPFAPLPLFVEISMPCDEALKTLNFYECVEIMREKYAEKMKQEGWL